MLGATAGVLAAASAACQVIGEARDRRRYQPPGRLVRVGGHRLHIRCAGAGSPTVVIIPAIGGNSAAWLEVQDALSTHTAVCVYDRPGLGWSDPVPAWPSAAGMARDLHGLLEAAGVAPPFVLAGHSMGGLVARMFAHLYPDEVAGLALVDSSHPEQDGRLAPAWRQDYRGGKLADVSLDFAKPLGLRRIRQGPARDARAAFALSSRDRRASAKELLAMNAICRQVWRIPGDLGDLPLAVISSSECDPRDPDDSKHQRTRSRFYEGWIQLQRELAALSSDSIHVVAENSGHHVQRDDPQLVISTITDLVRRAGHS
jgi:pimeloyl-ACP methyl ester carboxylesterase